MMAVLPSSLLKMRENGSVWYMRKPLDVARWQLVLVVTLLCTRLLTALTDSKAAVVLVKGDEVECRGRHG